MSNKIKIDLNGEHGNAFYLLSVTKDLATEAEEGKFNWDEIYTEMTSSDYDNLLNVMEKYFGDIVEFI
jgi:hypothetical protein